MWHSAFSFSLHTKSWLFWRNYINRKVKIGFVVFDTSFYWPHIIQHSISQLLLGNLQRYKFIKNKQKYSYWNFSWCLISFHCFNFHRIWLFKNKKQFRLFSGMQVIWSIYNKIEQTDYWGHIYQTCWGFFCLFLFNLLVLIELSLHKEIGFVLHWNNILWANVCGNFLQLIN